MLLWAMNLGFAGGSSAAANRHNLMTMGIGSLVWMLLTKAIIDTIIIISGTIR